MKPKVILSNVTKRYSLYKKNSDKLLDIFSIKKRGKSFFALKDISFEVFEGETVGVVGINGSGKSTLSSILAQVIPPSSGELTIHGQPSLIAISAGLNNNLSGIENIELKCLMLGLSKAETQRIKPDIIEFADIGDFIEQPVKNYSSGMKSRLGFAISVHTDPDLLIVDEALSVGDKTFYDKCLVKINEFKEQGKTIFFISHSLSQIKTMTDRVLWLHFGELKKIGETNEVLKEYQDFVKWFSSLSKEEKKAYRKKMLSEQSMSDSGRYSGNSKRSQAHKKGSYFSRIVTFMQVLISLVSLTIAGLFLFIDKPQIQLSSYFPNISIWSDADKDDGLERKEAFTPESIGSTGFIQVEKANLYRDEDLSDKVEELPFSTKVYVEEKSTEKSYKILYDDKSYFTKGSSLLFDINEKQLSTISFQDQLFMFDDSFKASYAYFLAFFDSSYEEIDQSLRGLTEEVEDEEGNRFLVYGYDNVTYRVTNQNVSDAIIFNNLTFDEEALQFLKQEAKLVSEDEKMYLVETEGYNWYYNVDKQELLLEKK
ncbi:teichoic acids export ABC transporter ATP-binding subunit TagH [Rossellomorea sp. AcN35-11]|nr:teichoic acids export ABC transporter ATP-binding subunit TagH [Rossellomorea aquimaris]WJV30760.1 teichoic acids export ABC transporter ATP-binding subunit TagH [Rossellomorea sp. AcN35-11]